MKKIIQITITLAYIILCETSAQAAVKYWDLNGVTAGAGTTPSGSWNTTTANWDLTSDGTGAATTFTAGDIAVFSAGTDATGSYTITGTGVAFGGMTNEEGTVTLAGTAYPLAAGQWTIKSGALVIYAGTSAFPFSAAAGSQVVLDGGRMRNTVGTTAGNFLGSSTAGANTSIFVTANGGIFDVSTTAILSILNAANAISGPGGITKEGLGILGVAANCTYAGPTVINNGTLRMRTVSQALPTTTDVTINSPGVFDPAVSVSVKTVNGNGAITYSGGGTLTISGTANSSPTGIIGPAGVSAKLTKSGSGTLTLSAANTYDGTFTLSAGTCTVNSSGKLCGALCDLAINGGILNLNNTAQTIENLTSTASAATINLGTGHTLTQTAAASGTYSGTIAGAGGFTKTDANNQSFSGANSYDGVTAITGTGTITVLSATALGSTVGKTTVASGAGLNFNGATTLVVNEPVDIAGIGNTVATGGAINVATAGTVITFGGTITLTTDAAVGVSGAAGTSGTFSGSPAFTAVNKNLTLNGASGTGTKAITGVIALGTGGVTKLQSGSWGLSGANTYSGPTAVSGGGLLVINSIANVGGGASSLGAPTSTANGTIALGSTTTSGGLQYTGSGHSSDRVIDLAGTTGGATLDGSGSGALTLTSDLTASGAGSKTLTLTGTSLAASTLGGAVADNGGANITALTKSAAGTWVLSGASTYSGATAISAGTLSINTIANVGGGASALGNPVTAGNGTIKIGSTTSAATLKYTGSGHGSDRVIDLAGTTGGATLDASGSAALTLTSDFTASGAGSKTLTLTGTSTDANTIGGAIVNNSSVNKTTLTKSGLGTWVLSGVSTYSGDTTISAGALSLSGSGTINSSPNIIDNASLDVSGHSGGTYTLASGQTLKGNGGVNGTIVVASGATVAPGTSIGTLYFTNAPTLSGTAAMEINKAAGPVLTGDKLVVVAGGGPLVYGGALTITASGLALSAGDTFDLFDADSFSGSFTSVTPAPGVGLVWDTSQLTVDGTIKAVCSGTLAASAGANQTICYGAGVAIGGSPTATSGSGGYTYLWTPSTGLSSATAANPIASPTTTTLYMVTVTDSVGCIANSGTVTVTPTSDAPTISVSPADTTVCSGTPASFSVTASASGPLSYSWSKKSNGGWGSAWSTSGSGSTFRASSTDNDFGDTACTSLSSANDINSPSGNALGMYGGGGGDEAATRTFTALTSGQVVSIDVDNGNLDASGAKQGFSLQTSGGADVLQFYFLQGNSNYKYNDGTEHDTGIPFQRTGVRVQFRLTSATTYALFVTPCGGSVSQFTGSHSGAIAQLKLFNTETGGGNEHNVYFNNFVVGGYTDNADNYSGDYASQDKGDQPILIGNGGSSYTTPTLSGADNGAQYQVVVSSCGGSALSSAATLTVNPLPTITLGTSPIVCQATTSADLPYTATTESPTQYSINFDGAAEGQGFVDVPLTSLPASPIVITVPGGAATGTYNGTLTVKNANGCVSAGAAITVTINPAATVNAGADQIVCASSPNATLAGSIGGGASSATWSGGAGIFTPNDTTLNAVYHPTAGEILAAATITLTLTTDDPAGPCGPVSDSMVITINPAATVNAGPDQTVCGDNSVTTLAGSIGGSASSATWSGGAGSFAPNSGALNATYTPTVGEIAAGTVTLTLTTDDPDGAGPCGAVSDSIVITIDRVTATNVTYVRSAGSSLKISKTNLLTNASDSDSETITLVGVGTDGVNLLTTNGVTLTTDADWIFYTNSVTPNAPDSFSYKVTDARGCIGLGTITVQVVTNATGQGTTVVVSGNTATVGFAGIPGRSYQVQRSTNLVDWATLVTTNAPANGVFEWVDDFSDLNVPPDPAPSSAYYRLRLP